MKTYPVKQRDTTRSVVVGNCMQSSEIKPANNAMQSCMIFAITREESQ